MMTVAQTTRLIAWVIAGLILLAILSYAFGPSALRKSWSSSVYWS
jgi:hypothetical protein